jgi:hypothetical protein
LSDRSGGSRRPRLFDRSEYRNCVFKGGSYCWPRMPIQHLAKILDGFNPAFLFPASLAVLGELFHVGAAYMWLWACSSCELQACTITYFCRLSSKYTPSSLKPCFL